MKIIVVGSNGFVGQHLISKLMLTFDVLCIGRSKNLGSSNYKTFAELGPSELNDTSFIIFCYSQKKIIYEEIDYIYSKNVLETILSKIDPFLNKLKGVIYLSSFAVYRGYQGGVICEDTPIKYSRNDFYAHTKFMEEKIILDFAKKNSIDHLILRTPGIVGPGVHGNLYYKIVMALKNNKELILENKDIPFNVILDVETITEIVYDFIAGIFNNRNQLIILGPADVINFELIVERLKSKLRSSSSILWGLSELRGPSVVKITNPSMHGKYLKRIDEIINSCDSWIVK